MSTNSNAYRTALQVSSIRVASLTDVELGDLVRLLLLAQSHKAHAPVERVIVNTEEKAKDDGCDAWSGAPATPDPWLGDVETCWQLKAGTAGEPAKLKGEALKKIPLAALADGKRLVVIASGSTNGEKGERDRTAALVTDAASKSLPVDRIATIGSERLTEWCNQHPAIAMRWSGRSSLLAPFDAWSASEEHQVDWHPTAELTADVERLRADLDFDGGQINHIHLMGHPGVGKSRLAMEICRGSAWNNSVVYARQSADINLGELIIGVADDAGARMVLVADEVQFEQLAPLRDYVARANGRVKLITVGHSSSPDPARIPSYQLKPLPEEEIRNLVRLWFPELPPEHVDFVASFADGYVRLAKLAAFAVAQNPTANTRELLNQSYIRDFLDRMLGGGNHSSLYVVAACSGVGWTGDREKEGQAIAEHLGLNWPQVKVEVEQFQGRLGIAPRGGRVRYISPRPLAVHLAVEAWTIFPDQMRSLVDVLPTQEAKDAYYERLRSLASDPRAREFAREELRDFFSLARLYDEAEARRWAALVSADAAMACHDLALQLRRSSVDERLQLRGDARRSVVSTLARMAWKRDLFHDAAVSLALLSEAENESWGNNATGEFKQLYQVHLGGTSAPYFERLYAIEELQSRGSAPINDLVLHALASVADRHESRMSVSPVDDGVPAPEWRPRNGSEHLLCVEAALGLFLRFVSEDWPLGERTARATVETLILCWPAAIRQML